MLRRPDGLEAALFQRLRERRRSHGIIGEEHRCAEMHENTPCWLLSCLGQCQFAKLIVGNRVAALAIRGRTAAVARDNAGLLALDVLIDARHPGVDLV